MKIILLMLLTAGWLYSDDGFEGVIKYKTLSAFGESESVFETTYYIKGNLIRKEYNQLNRAIHVTQFDSDKLTKTVAFKDEWISEVFDVRNAVDRYRILFDKYDIALHSIESDASVISCNSENNKFTLEVEYIEPRIRSGFLQFFEPVRFVLNGEDVDYLYIPKRYTYRLGNVRHDLELISIEDKILAEEVFELP